MSNRVGPNRPLGSKLRVQSSLGFATMDIAANLDIATNRALTDLRQYKSDIVFSDLKFPLCSEIATVEVVISPMDLSKNGF